tara:strand:- start:338 stop:532 length:195 start_codon:yes stop_codon:yes gene_type:complete
MRDSSWHSEIQARYRGYTVAELQYVRADAKAAAQAVISGSPRQNDYLDMAIYASQELKRRENLT